MDELFTDSIGSEFVMVGWGGCSFVVGCLIGGIVGARVGLYVVLGVHFNLIL